MAVPEVIEAYRNNRSFALGTYLGQSIVSLSKAHAIVEKNTSNHVQVLAERCFVNFLDGKWRYVRGCSGFSGYARGRHSRRDAEAWFRRMQEAVGEKWSEWGSEQVTSNLLIANASDSVVLPYPRRSANAKSGARPWSPPTCPSTNGPRCLAPNA